MRLKIYSLTSSQFVSSCLQSILYLVVELNGYSSSQVMGKKSKQGKWRYPWTYVQSQWWLQSSSSSQNTLDNWSQEGSSNSSKDANRNTIVAQHGACENKLQTNCLEYNGIIVGFPSYCRRRRRITGQHLRAIVTLVFMKIQKLTKFEIISVTLILNLTFSLLIHLLVLLDPYF